MVPFLLPLTYHLLILSFQSRLKMVGLGSCIMVKLEHSILLYVFQHERIKEESVPDMLDR
jgi:hypothetical protein